MKNKLRALYIAFAAIIGYDVRFTRKGKAYFVLRDQKHEHKSRKRIRALLHRRRADQ